MNTDEKCYRVMVSSVSDVKNIDECCNDNSDDECNMVMKHYAQKT